jgi:adenylate cyclase
MIQTNWNNLLTRLEKFSSDANNNKAFTLQEQLIVGSSILYIIAGFIWGMMYLVIGESWAGVIPFSYSILLGIMFFIFLLKRNTKFFISAHHLITLLLPFLLQLTLGGFVNSSVVILWSFTSPLTALVINTPRHALRWFIAFLIVLLLGGVLDPYIRRENLIPPALTLLLFVMNMTGVLGISFVLLYYLVNEKDTAYELLHLEQDKSDKLLLNVLPKKIANILKNESRLIADSYSEASILFADLVGFTPLSSEMSPIEMVQLLNEVYTHLDYLVEKYSLEKIRTIGDNYMVTSGVPTPRPDHAQALARMALEICNFTKTFRPVNDKNIQFRLGINSGSLVAGVVGQKNFHYDVWGDMVNVASRMESHGLPGKIQITKATYELIAEQFECEPRGMIHVKGKGEMETFLLVREKGK